MQANAIGYLVLIPSMFALSGCFSNSSHFQAQSESALPNPSVPEWGWRCLSRFEVEGELVSIWRDFEASGKIYPYFIQSWEHEPHGTSWVIDPRPNGPPAHKPKTWSEGRSEAEVLRDGPDYVHINYAWNTEVVGPVHVTFHGDGTYAGTERLFSAREVRRWTGKDGKMGGLSGGLSKGPILRALYRTHTWTFSVTDAAGKALIKGAFTLRIWRARSTNIGAFEEKSKNSRRSSALTIRRRSEALPAVPRTVIRTMESRSSTGFAEKLINRLAVRSRTFAHDEPMSASEHFRGNAKRPTSGRLRTDSFPPPDDGSVCEAARRIALPVG